MKTQQLFSILKRSAVVVAFLAVAMVPMAYTTSYFEISKNLDIFTTLFKELNTYYVDDVDPSDVMREGIDAMLNSLDPYTNFISESEIEGYRLQTTGKYGGIGAVIRKQKEKIIVAEPYEGYPADKAGLKAGDQILEIEGKTTEGKSTEEVSKILKGQPGTQVKARIKRLQADGTEKEMEVMIEREEIKIKNVPYFGMIDDQIGYIRLAHFTEKAGKEVQDALRSLKEKEGMTGVILDLRGNPGGLLNEAVNVSNTFIEKGKEIVSTKGKIEEWNKTFKTLNAPVDTDLPVVVLTDKGSASASEIVSGSLQDLDRGVIVGQKTFGKGLVQTTRSLTYNTKLKVTTAKYYIPSGRCIQALNYADKNEEGEASRLPDSLKTEFKTAGGRSVYDGAGIDPDVIVENAKPSKITSSLVSKNLIFDYATIFATKTESIAEPRDFEVSDDVFNDFVSFLSDKSYDYTTKSEKILEDLKQSAEKEKYFDAIRQEYDDLKTKMMHDKKKDLYKQKEEIKSALEREIVSRYYYKKGRIQSSFKTDEELVRAMELLKNNSEYHALLGSK